MKKQMPDTKAEKKRKNGMDGALGKLRTGIALVEKSMFFFTSEEDNRKQFDLGIKDLEYFFRNYDGDYLKTEQNRKAINRGFSYLLNTYSSNLIPDETETYHIRYKFLKPDFKKMEALLLKNRGLNEYTKLLGLYFMVRGYSCISTSKKEMESVFDSLSLKSHQEKEIQAKAFNEIGIFFKNRGDIGRAVKCFQHSLSLKKENPDAVFYLGFLGKTHPEAMENTKTTSYLYDFSDDFFKK